MRRFILYGVLGTLLFACGKSEAPQYTNPIDPVNPEFTQPQAQLVPGFKMNAILENTNVRLEWDGAYENGEYACFLKGYDASFSDWAPEKSKDYNYLDEGTYTFLVKERVAEFEQEEPDSLTFTVDAINQTSLILTRWYNSVESGSENYIDLQVEEAQSLIGFSTALTFSSGIEISNIEKYCSDIEAVAEGVGFFTEIVENQIVLDFLILGLPQGFSGSSAVCRIYYTANGAGDIEFVEDKTEMRNKDNVDVPVNLLRNAIIDIE